MLEEEYLNIYLKELLEFTGGRSSQYSKQF